MSAIPFTLAQALQAMGVAEVLVGTTSVVSSMVSLGAVEGDVTVDTPFGMNKLTAPELTGDITHQQTITTGDVKVHVPLILGDPTVWAKIMPLGVKGMGWSTPQKPQEVTVCVIPRAELGGSLGYASTTWTRTAGNGVGAATGSGAAPKNAIWLWRATPTIASVPFKYANGGKVITEVIFTAMFDGTRPEGHKALTIGDPMDASITGMPTFAL